ncbi:MAG: hypothetical protein ACRC2K_01535 [Clostridium sp.]
MAKEKKGFDVNNNFENLKAQMMKKREIAESLEKVSTDEEVPTPSVENVSEKVNSQNTINESNNVVNFEHTNVSNEVNQDVNINVHHTNPQGYVPPTREYVEDYIEGYAPQNGNTPYQNQGYIHVPVEAPQNPVSMSKIVIKRVEKPEQPKRITYYLRPETIKKIDKFSRLAGMGKSEFVQQILDTVLNNLEIEK